MTFRTVATDLDGTLLRSDGTLSPRSLAALRRAGDAGALVLVVTGRPPRWVHDLGLESVAHEYVLCANGAITYDVANRRVVSERRIDEATCRAVMDAVRKTCPAAGFASEAGLDFRYDRAYVPHATAPPGTQVDDVVAGGVAKLLVRDESHPVGTLRALVAGAVGDLAVLTWSGLSLLEISAPGVTKASAVAALAEAESTVAFGDMPNDAALLAWAGHGVAVANAHEDVLAVADEVTASNDDDGVALVLERIF